MLHRWLSWMRTTQNLTALTGPVVAPNGCGGPCLSHTLEIGIIVVKHVETKETTVQLLRIARKTN
jgi:Ser-tRNA(Ala) deacylase AlaX